MALFILHLDMLINDNHIDKELLARIADGDEKSFEILVNTYSDLLGTYIFRLTHSRETAEEIVQDIFMKIWMHREGLREVNNFHAWLYIMSKNQAINALRKLINEQSKRFAVSETLYQANTENNEWRDEKLSIIETAITHLPPQQKKVYLLHRREGFSYKEIASKMNISTETVKKYLQYATRSIVSEVESITKIGFLLLLIKKF